MGALIIGAGGHGHVVADILLAARAAGDGAQPAGFLDDDRSLAGATFLGLPVLGCLGDLLRIPHDAVVVAIGDNAVRARVFGALPKSESLTVARHPSAVLASSCSIGAGSMICAGVVVNPSSRVGVNVILNTGCTIDHHNMIGDHAHIAPGVHLGGNVKVGEGALVGIGATVMPGCTIGAWSVVGAGALVKDDVPDGATAVGIPARVLSRQA